MRVLQNLLRGLTGVQVSLRTAAHVWSRCGLNTTHSFSVVLVECSHFTRIISPFLSSFSFRHVYVPNSFSRVRIQPAYYSRQCTMYWCRVYSTESVRFAETACLQGKLKLNIKYVGITVTCQVSTEEGGGEEMVPERLYSKINIKVFTSTSASRLHRILWEQ